MSEPNTRERILEATAELYRRQGMSATGIKQIAAAAKAPFGSIYHHFPGGKEQISAEVIRAEGARYGVFVAQQLAQFPNPVDGIPHLFEGAGKLLESMNYSEACSIETIALEVASTNERLRLETAEVFEAWLTQLSEWFGQLDLPEEECRCLALTLLTALEGSFVLCRSLRSTEPINAAAIAVQEATRLAARR
jgi:AcrR family transcriptional regulator